MCILLNVKKHEKTFALNVDIFKDKFQIYCKRKQESEREVFGNIHSLQYNIHDIHDIHVNIVFFS